MRDQKIACLLLFLVVFTELALGQLSSGGERVALLQLRSSLGIRSKEWPRKADPCLNWSGISCNSNGSVIGVNISGFRRTRLGSQNPQFSVDSLANLTFLQSFNASNFMLPGQIPILFGRNLSSLQLLDLSSCSVIGTIPPSIANLTNLRILTLGNNNLSGQIPTSFGRLSSLSILDLSRNSLSGAIPSSFASLANLSTLDISSNSFSGSVPFRIGTILALKSLNLSSNNFSGSIPAQLGNLSNLVELDLSFNEFSGSLPSDLRGLTSLQTLVLRNNRFNASFPDEVWSIPGLTSLDLSGNNFTGLLPDISFSSNGPAASLNLSRNSFYGNLTQLLRKFTEIDLSGNYFEGKVPNFTPSNATLSDNCLQDVFNQRSIDECQLFYARKGLVFDNFGQPGAAPGPTESRKKKNTKRLYILIGVLGGLGLLTLLSVCCLLFFICRRGRGPANHREANVGPAPSGGARPVSEPTSNARVGDSFTYQQLIQSTNEFSDSNLIKHGHSGDLYKGFLEGGTPIVVKKVDLRTVKKVTYPIELDFFGKVSHGRFVPFLGHYLEDEHQKFLVYKYMPNEDLASSFYNKGSSDDDSLQALDWIKRLKIAVGAAEGLSYLHHECSPPLVHRDVQASSILLDDKFEVRLGSLSEVCAQEGDTHQSRITRLLRLPQSSSSEQATSYSATANCAYDVYCFGKVLLELVTGKLGLSESADSEIKEYLDQTLPYINICDKELVTKIVDPLLIVDEDLLEEVWAMAIVARSCLNPRPSRRPPMRYILKALENPLKIVREEHTDSGRLRATSSRGSWNNVALFGSWRQSSDVAVVPGSLAAIRAEGGGSSSLKQSGTTGSQSNGSGGPNGSSSHRRASNEIFPEPAGEQDVERFHE